MGNCNFKSEYDNDNVVGRSLLSLPCSLHFHLIKDSDLL